MLYFGKKMEKSPKRRGLRPQTPDGLRRLEAPSYYSHDPLKLLAKKAFTALTSLLQKETKVTQKQ